MFFNLDGHNFDYEDVGYFPYVSGIDTAGNECTMVVSYDSTASGCNPYYWTVATHNRYGHKFSSKVEAEVTAKHAALSWAVKSVDIDSLKVGKVHFTVKKSATNLGDAE